MSSARGGRTMGGDIPGLGADSDPVSSDTTERARLRFEQAIQLDGAPRIEDFLDPALTAEQRSELLIDLLRTELSHRRMRGETPTVADYVGRFPAEASRVETVFRT